MPAVTFRPFRKRPGRNRALRPIPDIEQGRFRSDLYYRLNVMVVELSPLRERRDDIPLLAERFLWREAERTGEGQRKQSDEAMEVLQGYPWPGDVRQLQNVIRRAGGANRSRAAEVLGVDPSILSRKIEPFGLHV